MRSEFVRYEYWPEFCQAVFPGLVVKEPETWIATVDLGGVHNKGSNIFFTDGGEDPW